eukprot:258863-Chlamydomonas_euryale.AAC.1
MSTSSRSALNCSIFTCACAKACEPSASAGVREIDGFALCRLPAAERPTPRRGGGSTPAMLSRGTEHQHACTQAVSLASAACRAPCWVGKGANISLHHCSHGGESAGTMHAGGEPWVSLRIS